MSVDHISRTQVFPLNSQEKYSFKNGNPIINFQLGHQDAFLDGNSLFLNFKLRVNTPGGVRPNNNANIGVGATAVSIRMNERIGAFSIIERLVISEVNRNQTLEATQNTGRILCTTFPSKHSALEYNADMSTKALVGSREALTSNYLNREISVSLRLAEVSGLLQNLIPLSKVPLNISIQLASDSQALIVTDTANLTSYYEVVNPFISCDIFMPDPELRTKMTNQDNMSLTYDTYASIYNVQNSSNQTTNLNWGLGNVKSVFSNLLPTSQINSMTSDSFATPDFKTGSNYADNAKINRVSYLRASQNFPIQNELEIKTQSSESRPTVPILKNGLAAIRPWVDTKHCLTDLSTQCGLNSGVMIDGTPVATLSSTSRTQPKPVKTYGVDMDSYSGQGVDFRRVSNGLRVDGDMDGANPMGIYSFAIAKNTLVVNDTGIQVLA